MRVGQGVFLAVPSVPALAPAWRARRIRDCRGSRWKPASSLVCLAGFLLRVRGHGLARVEHAHKPWLLPAWARHLAAALAVPARMLRVAADVPGTPPRNRPRHPMLDGTVASAVTHRAASACRCGRVLFAPFAAGAMPALPPPCLATAATVPPGAGDWWRLALILHARLIGVAPPG